MQEIDQQNACNLLETAKIKSTVDLGACLIHQCTDEAGNGFLLINTVSGRNTFIAS